MAFEAGISGNPKGRPKGVKNKVNADREIARAIAKGMSMEDLSVLVTNKILDPKTSDVQQLKFMEMLLNINKFLLTTNLKIRDSESSKDLLTKKQKQLAQEELSKVRESRPNVIAKFSPKAS